MRTYFTIDVSGALGTDVFEAKLYLRGESVNDCSVPRATEVWLTETPTATPTWANQPAELTRLSGPALQEGCLAQYHLEWDATSMYTGSWTEVVAPQDMFVDGGTYVMQLRTEDTDGATSPWTPPCRFTVHQADI